MYRALYRKWRSQTFEELYGQEHITAVISKQCRDGKVSHAYLFCGTRGTGKTSTAKILAKAVNCEHPKNGSPCNECYACRSIDEGSATDVLEIDAASNNRVDDIRNLRDEVVYPPSVLKKRVYIIDEVHMLSGSAFNALLKTLEEPPEYVIFILATTELDKLPPTIISRCLRFDFSRINPEIIAERIKYVSKHESIEIDDDAALLLARLADGSMRDALSLLESCAGESDHVTKQSVAEKLGISGNETLVSLVCAIAEKNAPKALSIIEQVHRSSKDLGVFLQDLTLLIRDLLLCKQMNSKTSLFDEYFVFANESKQLLIDYSDYFTTETLFYFCSVLDEAQSRLQRYSADKKTVVEFAVIRLCDLSLSENAKALSARISELEKKLSGAALPQQTVFSAPQEQPSTEEPPKKEKVISNIEEPFALSAELKEALSESQVLLPFSNLLKFFVKDDTLICRSDYFTLSVLKKPDNQKEFELICSRICSNIKKIEFVENSDNDTQVSFIDEIV